MFYLLIKVKNKYSNEITLVKLCESWVPQEEFYFNLVDIWEVSLDPDTFRTWQKHSGLPAGAGEETLWGALIDLSSAEGAR